MVSTVNSSDVLVPLIPVTCAVVKCKVSFKWTRQVQSTLWSCLRINTLFYFTYKWLFLKFSFTQLCWARLFFSLSLFHLRGSWSLLWTFAARLAGLLTCGISPHSIHAPAYLFQHAFCCFYSRQKHHRATPSFGSRRDKRGILLCVFQIGGTEESGQLWHLGFVYRYFGRVFFFIFLRLSSLF